MTRVPSRLLIVAAAASVGCGGSSPRSAEEVARQWGDAVNARDWERACELSTASGGDCQRKLRRGFGEARLRFAGPAVNGGGTKPGDEYFSFDANFGTVFVTAVRDGDAFAIRVEAIVRR